MVPVYREAGNVPEFLRAVVPILEAITSRFEIIFAMDPSPDDTEAVILAHHRRDARVKLLKFSRRVGQPMATLAGLQYSAGDAVVVMDADLQDPPALVTEMVARWQEGFDVVLAQRRNRAGESWLKRLTAWVGYKVINRIADTPIPPNTGQLSTGRSSSAALNAAISPPWATNTTGRSQSSAPHSGSLSKIQR